MMSEFTGFNLTRSIPDSMLLGVLSGEYNIFGGVIRDSSGKIVAHLINSATPGNLLSLIPSSVSGVFPGANIYQLHQIGSDINQLLSLAKVSMVFSGLTLAVSAASFFFLNKKLNAIDCKLNQIASDVKSIKKFLDLQERGRLITALRSLKDLEKIIDLSIRNKILINSRQVFGEIHEKYKELLIQESSMKEIISAEEYFIITALGHSLCSAELGLLEQAKSDLLEAQNIWHRSAQSFIKNHILKDDPQRLITKKYADHIKIQEIAYWIDFSKGSHLGIEQINELRRFFSKIEISFSSTPNDDETLSIGMARKLLERDKVLQGYISQYDYFLSINKKPTEIQNYLSTLSKEDQVLDFYVFIKNMNAINSTDSR